MERKDNEQMIYLKDCDAVVLVEACGSSCYSGVSRQTQIICDYNKQLLGCVLIGG